MILKKPATAPDNFRDKQGRIKRQAAKFFVYRSDENDKILGELNESHGVNVNWSVDVANEKATRYKFDMARDIPAAAFSQHFNDNGQCKRY